MPNPRVVDRMDWGLTRDRESHREYFITWLVESDEEEAPDRILNAQGLPSFGTSWAFGTGNDPWATCKWDADVQLHGKEEQTGGLYWAIKQRFSTKSDAKEQSGSQTGNPLTEPMGISGAFTQVPREMTRDMDGKMLLTSSLELMRGAAVTRNIATPTVNITMNLPDLPLAVITTALNRVNQVAMWGLGPRHIRLENAPWARKLHGKNFRYYSIAYDYLVNLEGFDEPIVDRGNRVLIEGGNKTDPSHFEPVTNVKEEKDPEPVLLDGNGKRLAPLANPITKQPKIDKEFNFFMLGMPRRL